MVEMNKTDVLPEWIRESFKRFLKDQEDLARILHLSIRGIVMLGRRHELLEILKDSSAPTNDYLKSIEEAAQEAVVAQSELDEDFPILHQQATVAVWGALESLVRTFVAQWLDKEPNAWQVEGVKRLRIRLGEYESFQAFDRCLWVTDLLDREIGGPLRAGVGRFEALLQTFGLGGPIDEHTQKTLFELSEVRHAIVHRGGQADKKLVDSCPWLELVVGDRLRISHNMWTRYHGAATQYVLELIQRLRVHHGLGRFEASSAIEP
jgi:hypothetical protein